MHYNIKTLLCLAVIPLALLQANSQSVIITPGTTIVNEGNMVIENANLVNDGTINSKPFSAVGFKGEAVQAIMGAGSYNLNNLYITKTLSSRVDLKANIKVAGTFLLEKGFFQLGSNSVELIYPGGKLENETDSSRVYGSGTGLIFTEQPLNAPKNVDPGNLGFIITTQANLGNVRVERRHNPETNSAGKYSIFRNFNIIAENNQIPQGISFYFRYLESELDETPETEFDLHQKVGAEDYKPMVNNGSNTELNMVSVFGVESLHRYTMFRIAAALPLKLLSFNVVCRNGAANLQWITTNEINTKQFVVESSMNGTAWTAQKTIPSKNTNAQHNYNTTADVSQGTFFRLKMEDKDGKYTYSEVREISCNTAGEITLRPNPVHSTLSVAIQLQQQDEGTIALISSNGSMLMQQKFVAAAGQFNAQINMANLPAGAYRIRVTSRNGLQALKQVIKN